MASKKLWGVQEFFSKVLRKIGGITAKQLFYGLAWGFLLVNFVVTGATIAKFYSTGVVVIPANAADPVLELVFPEEYTDSNSNGKHDSGETYVDLNGNGRYDDNINTIMLADGWQPGTTKDFYFEVRNYDATRINQVSLEYVIDIKYSNLLPLTYSLTLAEDGGSANDVTMAESVNEETSFYHQETPVTLVNYGSREVDKYCLTITWPSEEDDAEYLRMPGEYISISLNWQQQYDSTLYELTLVSGLVFNNYISLAKTITFDVLSNYTAEQIAALEYVADVSDSSNESIKLYRDNNSDLNFYVLAEDTIYANQNCQGMFSGCSSLTAITFTSFNTIKTTSMLSMFDGCSNLVTLNLGKFNTAKVNNMNSMFSDCDDLTTIYVGSGWSTEKVKNSTNMFYNCSHLPNYDSSVIDKTNANTGASGYLTPAA